MESFDRFIDIVTREIINPIITLLALAAFVVFVWGIVDFIRGAGNEERRELGKRHMVWGIVGLVIIFGARGIITFIASLFGIEDQIPQ